VRERFRREGNFTFCELHILAIINLLTVMTCWQWWPVDSDDLLTVMTCWQWWPVDSDDLFTVMTCLQWWPVDSDDTLIEKMFHYSEW